MKGRRHMMTCTGRAAGGSAAMPPPSDEVASQRADRLTPAHCKGLVEPLCLRTVAPYGHAGHFAPQGRSVPRLPFTTGHELSELAGERDEIA